MLQIIARHLLVAARGFRLSSPWYEVAEAVWPETLKRIAKERGNEFVVNELAKHNVELSWRPV